MAENRELIAVDLAKIAALPEVAQGEQHQDVIEVQNYLRRFGYMRQDAPLVADSVDDRTSRALNRFQQRYGLAPTGELDAPTRELMSTHRCGLADIEDPLAFSALCKWNHRNLTFAVGPLSADVSNAQARGALTAAMTSWAAAGAGLTFTEVGLNQSPDFIVDWRQANDPDHSMVGGVLAHADFPPGCSVVVPNPPLPLHYDDQEHTWVIGAVLGGFDIETVALHEIGHLLGLGHTNVSGSVMYPFVNSNFTLRALRADDLAGIRSLYPAQPLRAQEPAINADGRLEVFMIGLDSRDVFDIRQSAPNAASWNGVVPMGGQVKQLSAVRNADGRLELFGIGMDDALWHSWQAAPSIGPWSGWHTFGGGVKQISASCNADGRVEVFAIGMDNALWSIWQTVPSAGPWSEWNSLGGGVKRIAPALNSDGRLELFAIGMDNSLWHNWQSAPSAGPWSGWHHLGGSVKEILPLRNADGRLEIFAIGFDDALWVIGQTAPSAGPWTGWVSLGGNVKQIAGALDSDGRLEVFGTGSDNAVWSNRQSTPGAGTWSGWSSMGGVIKQLSAIRNADGRLELFGIGSNALLWHNRQTSPAAGTWSGWSQLS